MNDLITIQKFAQLCRTTPRAIRFYEKMGLFKPVYIDPATKYRFYDPEQAREVFYIRLMQHFQIPLKGMEHLLHDSTAYFFLEERIRAVRKEIDEKKKEQVFLEEIKEFVVEEREPKGRFKQESFGPYLLLSVRHTHGRYDAINSYIYNLFEVATSCKIPVINRQITIYYDPLRYRPHDSDMEIGLICKSLKTPPRELPKGYHFRRFDETKGLTYTYRGPFEYLTFIHQRMLALTSDRIRGFPFDIHQAGPWSKESNFDHITKVCYPLGS